MGENEEDEEEAAVHGLGDCTGGGSAGGVKMGLLDSLRSLRTGGRKTAFGVDVAFGCIWLHLQGADFRKGGGFGWV